MDSNQYDFFARLLHIVMAIIIFYTLIIGYSLHFLSPNLANILSTLNVSVATIAIPLFLARYLWTFFRITPELPQSIPKLQRGFAKLWHSLMYQIIFLVFISGVLMLTKPIDFFWVVHIENIISTPQVNQFFFLLHRISCALLTIMLIIHIAAVVKHTVISKNDVIRLMFPKNKKFNQ